VDQASDEVKALLDRSAIEAVQVRYVNANDADDWDGMAQCFAEDGRMGEGSAVGPAALRENFSGMRARSTTLMPLDRVVRTQHLIANSEAEVQGDIATAFCAATAYIVGERDGAEVLLVRGITYTDDFVRTAEGWRIKKRQHALKWMYEANTVEAKQSPSMTIK
jgi:hypothetical protein